MDESAAPRLPPSSPADRRSIDPQSRCPDSLPRRTTNMPKLQRRTSLVRRTLAAVPIALFGAALLSPAAVSARGHRRATVEQPASEVPAPGAPAESGSAAP